MIDRTELQRLDPAQRADCIYTQARAELSDRLWRVALGSADTSEAAASAEPAGTDGMGLAALLTLLQNDSTAEPQPSKQAPAPPPPGTPEGSAEIGGLGPNARYGDALASAAERTGVPAAAIASIIDAEAGKGPDGGWNTHSRNPRSSAAGLGQFLSSSWEGLARMPGTWLHQAAAARGWLDENGQVRPEARAPLLAMRYDPEASINAVADYAHHNLEQLRRAGVAIGSDTDQIARTAYLGHYLGAGEAARFLDGSLSESRSRALLAAQVGSNEATRRIAMAGDAATAHRAWFLGHVNQHLRPERFAA